MSNRPTPFVPNGPWHQPEATTSMSPISRYARKHLAVVTTICLFITLGLGSAVVVYAEDEPETPTAEYQIFLPLIQANLDADGSDDENGGNDGGSDGSNDGDGSRNSELIWDPRLDERGASLVPATVDPGEGYWRLVEAQWFNTAESQGRHHILMEILNANGERMADVPIEIRWQDGSTTVRSEQKPGEPFAANYPMYVVAPAYSAHPGENVPADRVEGMGLGELFQPDWNHHTSYGLTWQWSIAKPAVTPTVTTTPTVTASPTITVGPSSTPTPAVTATPTTVTTPTPTLITTRIATVTPAETVTPTATPSAGPTTTATPTATPLSTLTPTPTGTPSTGSSPFTATFVACERSTNGLRVEGHVSVSGALADGYAITYSYPGNDRPVPLQPAISGRGFRPGFYDFVLHAGTWTVWMIDGEGAPLSNVVTIQIDGNNGDCHVATVDFHAP